MTDTMTIPNFSERFQQFMTAAQAAVIADYQNFLPNGTGPRLEYEEGSRYIRIVAVSCGQRSAWAFIDRQTGAVLKAAGWKAPAKNFSRGNIFDDRIGCGRAQWTGVQ